MTAHTQPSTVQPRGLVWANRTFVDLHSFAEWLQARGYSYEAWAQNHRHRAGLPPLPVQAEPEAQRGTPGWLGYAIALATAAFVVCCAVILRRRRFQLRGARASSDHVPRADRVRLEAFVVELRRLAGGWSAMPAHLVRGAREALSAARGLHLELDGPRRRARAAHVLRAARRYADPSSGETFWYVAATLLAIAMGVAATRWG